MTYEEAVRIMCKDATNTHMLALSAESEDEANELMELFTAYSVAIELMEKQTAKPPIKTIDTTWGVKKEVPVCPMCDCYLPMTYFVGDGKKITYCENCGQAIDWGKNNAVDIADRKELLP